MRSIDDSFHSRIDQMIDLRHSLAVLASHMPWQEIEASLAKQLAREVQKARSIQEVGFLVPRPWWLVRAYPMPVVPVCLFV
jgi:IS5 family transposase